MNRPVLRNVRPDDVGALQRFIAALSPASRTQRFFAPVRELPRPLVAAIERGDPAQRLIVAEHDGEVVGFGQAADADEPRCEVALVVADAWQGRGLGARLLDALIEGATRAGRREAVLETQHGNTAMQRLAQRSGFRRRHPEDARLVFGQRPLVPQA